MGAFFFFINFQFYPPPQALEEATRQLNDAKARAQTVKDRVAALDAKLAEVTAKFEAAMNDKNDCKTQAERTESTLAIANRLVGGLASEEVGEGGVLAFHMLHTLTFISLGRFATLLYDFPRKIGQHLSLYCTHICFLLCPPPPPSLF